MIIILSHYFWSLNKWEAIEWRHESLERWSLCRHWGEWLSLTCFTLNMLHSHITKFQKCHSKNKKQSISKYIDYTVSLNSTEAQPGIYSTHLVSWQTCFQSLVNPTKLWTSMVFRFKKKKKKKKEKIPNSGAPQVSFPLKADKPDSTV